MATAVKDLSISAMKQPLDLQRKALSFDLTDPMQKREFDNARLVGICLATLSDLHN